MRAMVRLLVALLLVGVAAGSARGQAGAPAAPPREDSTRAWQRVLSQDGAFAILMPGEPKVSQTDVQGNHGRTVHLTNYILDLGTRGYMIGCADYDGNTAIDLDEAVAAIVGDVREVSSLTQSPIIGSQRPGRFVDFVREGYRWRWRLFTVDRRLYQLGVAAVADRFEAAAPEFFMNSFSLQR